MKEILKNNKQKIAEDYLKKCLVTFSGHPDLACELLLLYSKLVKKFYKDGQGIIFMLETIKKVALDDISEKVFRNLVLAA